MIQGRLRKDSQALTTGGKEFRRSFLFAPFATCVGFSFYLVKGS